jgi:hypothetical protein
MKTEPEMIDVNPMDYIDKFMDIFKDYSPSVHYKEEGYDNLECDEHDESAAVVIENHDREIEVDFEANSMWTLYFASSHAHYYNDEENWEELLADVKAILENEQCSVSITIGDKLVGSSMWNRDETTEEETAAIIKEEWLQHWKSYKDDATVVVEFTFFNGEMDKSIAHPLSYYRQ